MKKNKKDKRPVIFLLMSSLMIGILLIVAKYHSTKSRINKPMEFPEIEIAVATDLHYISPELTDHGYYFQAIVQDADGKTMVYSEEVIDAFLRTVLKEKPDVLVLTGDVTFNGAKKSHEDLAKKLDILENAGIQVLVLSGNHDVNSRNAAKFIGESYERVEGVTEEEFETIYSACGFDDAYAKDTVSSSYIWEFSGYRFLMLDVNGVEKVNYVSEQTLFWLEQELQKAKEDGVPVVAFSHQNLLFHSPLFDDGYVIGNAEAVVRLYKEYDVIANFTGHLHIQHMEEEEGFYEVATAALSISPTQYAKLTMGGNTLEYRTEPVNVSEWAKRQGLTSGTLTHFEEYAKEFFMDTAQWQAYSELFFWPEYEAMMEELIDYYAEQNYAYFSGQLDLLEQDEEMLNAWSELGAFISIYLESIAAEERVNQNYLLIEKE